MLEPGRGDYALIGVLLWQRVVLFEADPRKPGFFNVFVRDDFCRIKKAYWGPGLGARYWPPGKRKRETLPVDAQLNSRDGPQLLQRRIGQRWEATRAPTGALRTASRASLHTPRPPG
jgi:hypothetical protein